jgi:PAS domain S-box-containing protein
MGTLTEPGKPSGEESRADALAHVRGIVDTVREPLLVLDGRLRVRSANRSFYRTFRVSPRATEWQLLYDLGNGQWDIARLHSLLEEILSQNASFDDYEVEHDFPDIGRKVMLLNARRLRQAGTELILLAIEDVTEQRRLEAERRAIETRFTSLVKNIKDHSIFTIDAEGQVTSWNVAAEQILGYSEAEALGRHFSFIFTPEDREQGLPDAELRAAREHGRAEDERWHLRKGGERFWALGIVSALHDAEGRLSGFSKILRDMTERKRSEQALRDREKRFRALVEASSDVVFRMSPDWTEMRQLVGLDFIPETEAPSQTWLETCIPPDDRPRVKVAIDHAIRTKSVLELEHRVQRVDGSLGWTMSRAIPLFDAAGTITEWIGMASDITKRKEDDAERTRLLDEIQVERDRLSALLDSIQDEVWFADPQGRFTLANPAALKGFGLKAGKPIDIEHLAASLEVLRADSSPRPVEESPPLQALNGDSIVNQEEIIRLPAGGALRYREVSATPVRDKVGQIIGSVAVARDITERKQAEAALQEGSRRKDAFLATLAHELRNPLTPIRTGFDLLQTLRGDAPACDRPLQIIDRQLNHLVRLIDDLLDVSRISRGKIQLQKERLDLAEIIDAVLDISESGLGRGDRRLTISVPPQPLPLEGDPVRLVQIFANLLSNAVKFTDTGGHIALRVLRQGDQVEVRVQDDGRGIQPERLDDIFDMFAQAEPGRGGGLGIGLTLVRSLVGMHGGTVRADSEGPGRGATFIVSLPLCRSAPQRPVPHEATGNDRLPPHRRVLVVDDDRDIAEALRLLLQALNAEVQVAHDGAEAIRACESWRPTHVLMDLGMPGMDGYEAARRLRAEHPAHPFRLVALTGWGQDDVRQRAREAGFDAHLVKPVGVAKLKAVLSE